MKWWYTLQTLSVVQSAKNAAVQTDVDVSAEPVNQNWWVGACLEAWDEENPIDYVCGGLRMKWGSLRSKTPAQLEELKAHNLLKELSSWTSEHLPVSSGMSALLL